MTEVPALPDDKRPQVEALLADVFRLMEYPARLEFKDLADGSLGVAVHFEGELPGVGPGKRSAVVDSVQFWLNKVVNRPNVPRRWVNLGVGDFPAPRQERQAAPAPAQASAPAPRASTPPAAAPQADRPPRAERPPKGDVPPSQKPPRAEGHHPEGRRGREGDERALTPAPDPALSALGTLLAEKSARHGRLYGVMLLKPEQRALMLKAADAVKGVTAKAEGEGHWRRLVFTPEKLVPLLKKQVMPDYDDDEEE